MAVHAERAIQSFESGGTPVEMLVVGCPLNVADGFANALRNQGQAAHLKTADDLASLDEQLSGEICDLVVVNADSASVPVTQVVAKVRALSPRASLLLVGTDRKTMKPLALDHALQDFIDIDDPDHVALAIRREHQSHLWQQELARLKRQLSEAEERSNYALTLVANPGPQLELVLEHDLVRGRIWKRPDLDLAQGAENARQIERALLSWLQHKPRGLFLDVSEGPEVAGPKTEATLGEWFRAYANAKVRVAIRVGPSAMQRMQYRRLVQEFVGPAGYVGEDVGKCLAFLA